MTVLVLSIATYLLYALESPLLAELHLSLYAPDLAVALVVAAAVRLDPTRLVIFALVAGLLLDAFTPLSPLGLHAERVVVVAYIARAFLGQIPVRTASGRILLGMGLCLAGDFVLFVLLALFDRSFTAYGLVFARMVPHALLTGVAVPVVDSVIGLLWRQLVGKRPGIFYS